MTLAQGLLDQGRTIYTDNYYTSIWHTDYDAVKHTLLVLSDPIENIYQKMSLLQS